MWGTNALLARTLGQETIKSSKGCGKQFVPWSDYLCGMSVVWNFWSKGIYFITDH